MPIILKFTMRMHMRHTNAVVNELHNYLLREYFPKKTNFNKTSAVEILTAIKDINDRPRKMHNWKSTNFKFKRELAKTY